MKLAAILVAAVLSPGIPPALAPNPAPQSVQLAQTMTCFFRRASVSGINQICVYDCMGSEAATTIGSAEICPATITR